MIQIIVFSFNRALQLEALLASIRRHWRHPEHKLSVLYNTTGGDYQKAYDMLQADYSEYKFVKETRTDVGYPFRDYCNIFNLKKLLKYPNLRVNKTDFRALLNGMLTASDSEYTMYLTDDSVFIEDVALTGDDLAFIDRNPAGNQISLRLGKCFSGCPDSIPFSEGHLEWDFHNYRDACSWGYNFSLDAHIYSTGLCRDLQYKIIYNNPTTLEADICHYTRLHQLMDRGRAFGYPAILSFPINRVQIITDNESMGVSVENLNRYFLDGYRLEYIVPEDISEFQQYPDSVRIRKDGRNEILELK